MGNAIITVESSEANAELLSELLAIVGLRVHGVTPIQILALRRFYETRTGRPANEIQLAPNSRIPEGKIELPPGIPTAHGTTELYDIDRELLRVLLMDARLLQAPPRALNCVCRADVYTYKPNPVRVVDVIQLSRHQARRLPNFGRYSLLHLENALAELGLELETAVVGWPQSDAHVKALEAWADQPY